MIDEYKCDYCLSEITTEQRIEGMPMKVMPCVVCGQGKMISGNNQCDQSQQPTHEWVRPARRQRRSYKGSARKYYDQGGLALKKLE